VLTPYRPGTGWLHRAPALPKALVLVALSLGVFLLPPLWWSAATATVTVTVGYAIAGLDDGALGMRELLRQLFAVRWIAAVMLASQVLFLGPEPAVANAARVMAGLLLAALLTLTTPASVLLDATERGLQLLRHVGVDPERAALLLAITLGTIPVLARIAHEVRVAQRARGAGTSLRTFAIPFLVMSLRHADQVGEALTARGVR
jgi:biotin transport system permease protein